MHDGKVSFSLCGLWLSSTVDTHVKSKRQFKSPFVGFWHEQEIPPDQRTLLTLQAEPQLTE